MNENTTVLVGNWLRPKKEKKKKGPSSTAKGVYTCRLSLSLGVDHAAAGALQLSGMGFDGSLPIPYANSWWISLSLLIYDGLAQKNVNRKFSYETDIASERSNHDRNCVKLYKDFFCFFFFARSQREGGGPSARGAFDYLNRRSRGVTKPFLFGQRPACRKIPPRAREKRETLNENAHREGVRRRADVIYDR